MGQSLEGYITSEINIIVPPKNEFRIFKRVSDGKYYAKLPDGSIELINGSSSSGGGYTQVDYFTPSNLQTVFNISSAIDIGNNPLLMVNGQEQRRNFDYTVLGTVLTWLNNSFTLANTDKLDFYYN